MGVVRLAVPVQGDPGFGDEQFDPEAVLWVCGVDYLTGWRGAGGGQAGRLDKNPAGYCTIGGAGVSCPVGVAKADD